MKLTLTRALNILHKLKFKKKLTIALPEKESEKTDTFLEDYNTLMLALGSGKLPNDLRLRMAPFILNETQLM